jgi:thioester reductase-like protein
MGDRRTIFVTGFPGFISRMLLERLLGVGDEIEVVCLVQSQFEFQAREEAKRLGSNGHDDEPRVRVVVGDIMSAGLGLDADTFEDLASRVTDVFHLAAIYDLAVPAPIARKVNVWGTRHVIEFCRRVDDLRKFVYYSTCYVSGDRTGTVYEDELDMGQGFKNHYESTKHDAEYLVRQALREFPTIIIRPAIVVGHSETGETPKFDGPYFGMILIEKIASLSIPLPYLGAGRAEVNLVPVDFVADATVALWQAEDVDGRTFALADPDPLVARELYAEMVRGLGALGPLGKIPPILLDLPLKFASVRKLLGVPAEALTYFNHDVRYDCSRATEALRKLNIVCPGIRSYLPTLIEYYIHNRDRSELHWNAV